MTLDPAIYTAIVLFLLLLSALLSAAETAFTTASKARMLALENEGNSHAKLAGRIWKDKDLLIGTIVVGYNVINVISSAITTALMIEIFGETGVVYATIIMSVLIVLFVEILPKTIAIRVPVGTALALVPFLSIFIFILKPVTAICRNIIHFALKPFRIGEGKENKEEEAEQEIRGAIDLHADAFTARQEASSMLHAVVDITWLTVSDVMTHRRDMVSFSSSQPVDRLVQQILDAQHSYVPLYGKSPEDIVGVVDARRLLAEIAQRQGSTAGLDISNIVSPPCFIPESTKLLDQLQAFRRRGARIAFVVDEYGTLQGMLTLADILEEIVGHYDKGQFNALSVPRAQADGSYVLDGRFPIREINRELDWDLSDEHATTIAGLVIHLAERIPEPGETISEGAYSFQVISRKSKQLTTLKIRKMAVPEDSASQDPLN